MSEKNLVLKKNATILKSEEHLYNVNTDGYLLSMIIYTTPNDSEKMHRKVKNPEGKMLTTLEWTTVTIELFQTQMGQFTYWTSTVPVKGTQFRVHILGSKTLF